MKKVRVIIVDDDKNCRELLQGYCAEIADIEIIGECGNGADAVKMIHELKPDLVFLDIEMPEMDGFGVLRELQEEAPAFVFVTAHERYAPEAFSVQALDYLVKPFNHDRFRKTMERARKRISTPWSAQDIKEILDATDRITRIKDHLERIAVKINDRIVIIKTNEIDWIKSEGNYLRLHVGIESYLVRETMNDMEGKLNPNQFIRIHRSYIVNLDSIKEIRRWFANSYHVILFNGKKLVLSRNYREQLRNFLANR